MALPLPALGVHRMARPTLDRRLGLLGSTMLGIGATIGTSIFVIIGKAADMAGPAIIVSFLLAGAAALFTALDYAELGSSVPEAGGGYTFVFKAMGGSTAYLTGCFMWFGNIFYAAFCALGFATAIRGFLPTGFPLDLLAPVIVLLFFGINMFGSRETGRTQVVLTAALLAVLITFMVTGANHIQAVNYEPFVPMGIGSIFAAAGFVYVAYVGFEIICTASEEIVVAGKTVPRAIILSMLISAAIYLSVVAVAVGVLPYKEIAESDAP
ncbi:MAG: amino acid permease [Aigarchaeota archaeon]|nr:amino acid permease [Aigarchaeota archaeon]